MQLLAVYLRDAKYNSTMIEYNTRFILSRQYIAVSESLLAGYVCP